jgi:hypothetical protein
VLNAAGKAAVRIFWFSILIIQNNSCTAVYIVKLTCKWGCHGQKMGQTATEEREGGRDNMYLLV